MRLIYPLFVLLSVLFINTLSATTLGDVGQEITEDSQSVYEQLVLWYDEATSSALFHVGENEVSVADIFWMIVVLMLAAVVSMILRRFLNRLPLKHSNISASGMFTLGRLLHYIIITSAVLVSFSIVGVEYTELAIIAGALSVGIGFGLQSIFNNFISGLILLFERPIKVGDLIELDSGTRGRVKAINVRSTQVTTWDNIDVLVPNSEFISGRVTNYTLGDDLRRLHVPFGVAYGSDKELVKKAVIEAALAVPTTINHGAHKPDVWLVNFGDSSLDFELVVWVNGNKLPKDKHPTGVYCWEIETKLAEYNLEIPFPQRDLRLRSVDQDVVDTMQKSN